MGSWATVLQEASREHPISRVSTPGFSSSHRRLPLPPLSVPLPPSRGGKNKIITARDQTLHLMGWRFGTSNVDSLQLSDTGLPKGGGDRTGPAWRHRGCWRRKSGPTALDHGSPPVQWNDMHVRRIWAAQVPMEIRGSRRSHGKGRGGEGAHATGLATTQVVVATVGGEGRWCRHALSPGYE